MRPAVLFFLLIALSQAAGSPLSPEKELRSFQLEPGLRATLVASEPLTASPCAFTWDESGRLFVAENRGYPTGGSDGKPLGAIALLEDTDGDGRMDKRTVFAEGLTFPNGLTPWRGGLIVTCAPDVLWLADTNGDGRADERRVLLTGFSTSGSTQLRVSHPTLGPDGWIYLTCGLSGGNIRSSLHPDRPALKTSTDVRFHPDTLDVETVDGRGQFGQTFDDYGRRFICMNRVQIQHVVLPSRLVQRNPNIEFFETVQNCPELIPNTLMGGGNGAARIYPISANVTTADSHAGTFTAACAVHIYRGDALSGYRGRAFSCDPTGNLVHWDELVPVGATFFARRSIDHREFMAGTDDWFRPVFLATGPDDALYVADMYRKTIEHPEYLPVEIRKRTDFEQGKNMGRIWRVTQPPPGKNGERRQDFKPFHSVTTPFELCAELKSLNSWRRDTAFRLLIERRDASVAALLRKSVSASRGQPPPTVVMTLRLMDILGELDARTLLSVLDRSPEGVAEVALELSGRHLANSAALKKKVLERISFHDRAGLWAILASGALPYESKRKELFRLQQDPIVPDTWQRTALLSSIQGQALMFARELADGFDKNHFLKGEPSPGFLRELGRLCAAEASVDELKPFAMSFADFAYRCESASRSSGSKMKNSKRSASEGPNPKTEWELPLLNGVAERLRSQESGPAGRTLRDLLTAPVTGRAFDGRQSAMADGAPPPSGIDAVLARSRRALTNDQPPGIRVAAAGLLGEGRGTMDVGQLLRCIDSAPAPELILAAARSVSRLEGANAADALLTLERWRNSSPAKRETLLAALFERNEQLPSILLAIESGILAPAALSPMRRNSLLHHKDDAISRRAGALFQPATAGERMKAYEQSKAALGLAANAANGHEVFKRACANCHRLDREGVAFGPDLFGIRNQPKETLLLHIIVPEHEIAPNFAGYTLETKDGRALSGLIAGETPTSVTLRQALGIEETILRTNIVSLAASSLSLMPQELEKAMSTQELADLLAYLKGESQ
ncbi:MAG: hypothetical protein QOF48_1405 [Verrucomicrobiota bacterium]|jgi:putative membrane-bound dehydrogenase-like protein